MVALLTIRRCRPVLTAVAGCHLSRKQCLPDPADTSSSIATAEVLAVDAARKQVVGSRLYAASVLFTRFLP
jgi:hypothetical protein